MLVSALFCFAQNSGHYLGFDKNGYPGDDLLPALHKTFAYTGYWLNNPPGMTSNPWAGKREVIRKAGFGFLILFNGRLDVQLRGQDAAALGASDAKAAVESARSQGFPAYAVIFIDQEEGGRLLRAGGISWRVVRGRAQGRIGRRNLLLRHQCAGRPEHHLHGARRCLTFF